MGNLAAALPAAVPDRDAFVEKITALHGDAPAVEAALSALDRDLLAAVATALETEPRKEIEAAVEKTLEALRGRIPAEELESSRERLTHQVLRQRLTLQVLSLFSPKAD